MTTITENESEKKVKLPKSRVQEKIEAYLGKPLIQILKDEFQNGESRYNVHKKLIKLTNGEIKFCSSSIWNCVKAERAAGKIDFWFDGKIRKKEKSLCEKPKTRKSSQTNIKFSCRECDHCWEEKHKLGEQEVCCIGLKTMICPKCGKKFDWKGMIMCQFDFKGKTYTKAVIQKFEKPAECFVNEKLESLGLRLPE